MSFIRNAFQTMHPAAQVVMLGCIVMVFMALAAGVGVLWAFWGRRRQNADPHATRGHRRTRPQCCAGHEQRQPNHGVPGRLLGLCRVGGQVFLGSVLSSCTRPPDVGPRGRHCLGHEPGSRLHLPPQRMGPRSGIRSSPVGWGPRSPSHGAHQGAPRLFRRLRSMGSAVLGRSIACAV